MIWFTNGLKTKAKQGRKIEENVWNEYLDSCKKNPKDLIAYHFKEKFKKEDNKDGIDWKNKYGAYDIFIKYTIEKSIWWLYIIFTILLGSLGSFFCTLFCHFVFPCW